MKLTENQIAVLRMIKDGTPIPRKGKHNRPSALHANAVLKLKDLGLVRDLNGGGLSISDKNLTIGILTKLANREQFNNISFYDDLIAGRLNYSALGYVIEYNAHVQVWELSIIATTLSEFEGSEEGILAEYTYMKKSEAEFDINEAIDLEAIHFDKI